MIFFCSMLFTACSSDKNVMHFNTIEEAINHGIEFEGINSYNIIGIEEFKGTTIVFYSASITPGKDDVYDGLGMSIIKKEIDGYRWYRDHVPVGFEGGDYHHVVSYLELNDEITVQVSRGRVDDLAIKKVIIGEKEIWDKEKNKTNFFYYVHRNINENISIDVIR